MKKLIVLFAAATLAVSAFAADPASAPVDPAARTESMAKKLSLSERQVRKVSRLNERFTDVLGEEITFGKPIYGGYDGPYYDTPGRPHPSGHNGVPGSWYKSTGGSPLAGPEVAVAPAEDAATAAPAPAPVSKEGKKLLKRRAKYEKKLSRILTAEQYSMWQEGQKPFVVR